jgi:hypothetical protein
MKTDSRVDAYFAKAPSFAQPILAEVRKRVAKANPAIEETIKWNVPFFLLDGKILASLAAFKKHVKVGVWTGMSPSFQDLSELSELMPAKEFAAKLAAASKELASAMSSGSGKKTPAKKMPAKREPVKKAAAKKVPAKKAPAKKAPTKKAPAKKAAKRAAQ